MWRQLRHRLEAEHSARDRRAQIAFLVDARGSNAVDLSDGRRRGPKRRKMGSLHFRARVSFPCLPCPRPPQARSELVTAPPRGALGAAELRGQRAPGTLPRPAQELRESARRELALVLYRAALAAHWRQVNGRQAEHLWTGGPRKRSIRISDLPAV